jgi:hypothetical protein
MSPSARALALLALALSACTEDSSEPSSLGEGPLYAVMYEVFDDVGSNSYLSLIDSLDIDALDPSTAREYVGGRAYLQTWGGWLFVGEPSTPIVRRYSVGEDGTLQDERSISFANFGLEAGTIDPWSLVFIDAHKAYLFDYREGTHIVWDPTTMEITGEIPAAPEFRREGLSIDGSPAMVRGDRLYRSVFWADYTSAVYSTEHLLAVYDVNSDELVELVTETRCPAPGNLTHMDEAGDIYFSNWIWPVAGTLLHDAPSSCVLRVPAGSDTFDPDWTLSYGELSGGHEGGMFTYLGQDQGLVAIFDESATPFDSTTDPWDLAGRPQWSLWRTDLADGTGAPIDGIPPNSGAYTPALLGDRTLLLVPGEGWARTDVYELTDEGAAPGLDIPGWSYAFVQVR